jgi:hypothetical protein
VHELYLCATPNENGRPWRACAERYMRAHLDAACPKLVVAFGQCAANFLAASIAETQFSHFGTVPRSG